jgi:hypothetical protein
MISRAFRGYSQNARVDAGVHVKPEQQSGSCGEPHSCPLDEQLAPDMVPVPLRRIVCGLPVALSVRVIVPLRVPGAVGLKVTLIVQFAPAARVKPQSFVSPKFALATMFVMLRVAVPELVSVTGRGWLVCPTSSVPKPKVAADKAAFGDPLLNEAPPPLPQPPSDHNPTRTSARHFLTMPPRELDRRRVSASTGTPNQHECKPKTLVVKRSQAYFARLAGRLDVFKSFVLSNSCSIFTQGRV